jgi:RNA polymerase sigma factor (sigma-70 family)
MSLYTGDPDLATELAQEALARANLHWHRVAKMDSPGGWVHRVARNLASSHFRRQRLERLAAVRAAARPGALAIEAGSTNRAVMQAVAALPPRQREALALRFVVDLSVDETALRMGCAEGTVRALTSQGIARLRSSPVFADLKES